MPDLGKLLSILAGAALTLLTSYGLGAALLNRLTHLHRSLAVGELRLFRFALGATVLSLCVFALCAFGLVYDLSFVVLVLAATWIYWRWGRDPVKETVHMPRFGERRWCALLAIVSIPFGALYFINALAPEILPDATLYHLGLVTEYYRHHGFADITWSFYAFLSQGMEMLYLFAYAFGRHSAAKLVHFAFLAATLVAMLLLARRLDMSKVGVAAVILFGCSSVVGTDGASTYNDAALTFYQFLTFYALTLWVGDRDSAWPWIIGVFAGFAVSIKYTAVFGSTAALLALVWSRGGEKPDLRRMLQASLIAAILFSPWLIRNAILTGNPTAPFLNGVFPNAYNSDHWESEYRDHVADYRRGGVSRHALYEPVETILELTTGGGRLGGFFGPVWLLLPLGLFAVRERRQRWFLLAAAVTALPWLFNAGTRFLMPAAVFATFPFGFILTRFGSRVGRYLAVVILFIHAGSNWPPIVSLWHPALPWAISEFPLRAALRIEPDYSYIVRHVPGFRPAQFINRHAGPSSKVFSLVDLPRTYINPQVWIAGEGVPNMEIADQLFSLANIDFQPGLLVEGRWNTDTFSALRIIQDGDRVGDFWRIHELAFFNRNQPIVGAEAWSLTASHDPWHLDRMLDGDVSTLWRTQRPLERGMSVTVNFGKPTRLSGISMQVAWGQHFFTPTFEGLREDGVWRAIDSEVSSSRQQDETLARIIAVDTLRRNGFDFLVVEINSGGYNGIAEVIAKSPDQFGLHEVGRHEPFPGTSYRIYQLRETSSQVR